MKFLFNFKYVDRKHAFFKLMNLPPKSAASVFRCYAKMSNIEVLRFKVKKQS